MSSGAFSPGAVIGRAYRVVRPLAAGGMGAVYICDELSSGRRCAVKVMHARLLDDPKNRARFAQEAAVSEHIGTDHVVDVYARGVDEATGMPFIAMELLEGETLAARLWRGGRANVLPITETRDVLDQLATVLEAAHMRGLVHRDLKPENIFLTPRPHGTAAFTLKLLDFGVARFVDFARPTQNATAAIGTPLWMAPEQHSGAEISPSADVWAVGLIAFQMLTGRFYWLAANQRELSISQLLQELVFDPLPAASQRAAALGCGHLIPPGFDAWFSRCVVREPQARFLTAVDMHVLLGPALADASSPPRASHAPTPFSVKPYVEQSTVVYEAPTIVAPRSPNAPHLPPASNARRRTWTMVLAVLVVACVGLASAAMAAYLRFTRPKAATTQPSIPMIPIPLPVTGPVVAFPESLPQTWQGNCRVDARLEAFELTLRRHDRQVQGEIIWTIADGGDRRVLLSGTWDPAQRVINLSGAARNPPAFSFRLGTEGSLTGEMREGNPARVTPMGATLKTPLVGAAPP